MSSLDGRRVLVTRTRERASGLVDLLHTRGAVAVAVPLIATEPLASPQELDEAAAALTASPGSRWAAFTSATAVRLVMGVARERLDGVRLAAVGAETAAALTAYGRRADVVAAEADA
ncbi:MAG TPA: uroporphyrinogen-III synthase, partial [Candidatus Dormibacteraeota bacterium]